MGEQSITLRESPTEYLLFIHASQRERAKRIQGRNWDGGRKCWVYPRTPKTYNAIVGEFGEDLDDQTDSMRPESEDKQSPPQPEVPTATMVLEAQGQWPSSEREAEQLRERLGRLESTNLANALEMERSAETIKTLTEQLSAARTANERIYTQLTASRDGASIDTLITQLRETERRLAEQLANNHEDRMRILELETELRKSQSEVADVRAKSQTSSRKTKPRQYLIDLALDAANNDAHFAEIVRDAEIGDQLALRLHSELVSALAALLPGGNETSSLHELLTYARGHEILSPEEIDLAHTIRAQRNVVAHPKKSQNSTKARVLLVLYAAALLWPELTNKIRPNSRASR
jgi:hypothetical protein